MTDCEFPKGTALATRFVATDSRGVKGSVGVGGKLGTPLGDIIGSEASVSGGASIYGGRENSDISSRTSNRGLEKFTARATDKSEDNSGRFSKGTTDSTTASSGTFSRDSQYSDNSQSKSDASGTEARTSEADERRMAASRYREIGNRLVSEASFAESHGFQMSSDMSNLVQARYEDMRRERPELHLPDLASPNLSLQEMQRRDQGVTAVMADLMADLRGRKIGELGDVAGISPIGALGTNADLGFPSTPVEPIAAEPSVLPLAPEGAVDGRPYARQYGISLKGGAKIDQIDGGLVPAMAVVAEEAKRLNLPRPTITSGNDSGQHERGSAHYDNRGLDFRGKAITVDQGHDWARSVSDRLGAEYGVQFEVFPDHPDRNHLHVSRRKF